jgi:hypothetical protein
MQLHEASGHLDDNGEARVRIGEGEAEAEIETEERRVDPAQPGRLASNLGNGNWNGNVCDVLSRART